MIAHADVAGPLDRERAVWRGLTKAHAQDLFERLRNIRSPLEHGDGGLRKPDTITASRFAIEEGVEGHHVFDFDRMDPQPGCEGCDGLIAYMAEPVLNGDDHVHEAGVIETVCLEDIVHLRRTRSGWRRTRPTNSRLRRLGLHHPHTAFMAKTLAHRRWWPDCTRCGGHQRGTELAEEKHP